MRNAVLYNLYQNLLSCNDSTNLCFRSSDLAVSSDCNCLIFIGIGAIAGNGLRFCMRVKAVEGWVACTIFEVFMAKSA